MSNAEAAFAASLPPAAAKKASNLIRDARLSAAVLLIPLLALVFLVRLVQWHLLRRRYPILASSGEAGGNVELAEKFQGARWNLWFAVLLWPVLIVSGVVYLTLT